MKHATLFVLMIAAAAIATPALAALRPVQVAIDGSSTLAAKVNATDPTIDVVHHQDNTQGWGKPVVGTATTTLMFEVTANSAFNAIGVYNVGNPTERFEILPPSAQEGWYAVASFSGTDVMAVSIFDENNLLVATKAPFTGVQINNFGYYIENKAEADAVGYTEDANNSGDAARALVYKSVASEGSWWVCFDDATSEGGESTSDYDDAILFVQSLQATPVSKATWAAVKERFR